MIELIDTHIHFAQIEDLNGALDLAHNLGLKTVIHWFSKLNLIKDAKYIR